MNKKFEYVDDNPGSYFGMLVESLEDNKLEKVQLNEEVDSKDLYFKVLHFIDDLGYDSDIAKEFYQMNDVIDSLTRLLKRVEDYKKYESLKEDKFVPQDKMSKKAQKELNDKKRWTWGNTNPVTKVQPNKKAYDRKRDSKVMEEALTEDSEVFKGMSNALDDIEYLCNDTYNWGIDEWNDKNKVKNTAERIIDSANVLLDSIKKY